MLCLPSIALSGRTASKLCNNPKTNNPVASMLVRNTMDYVEEILVINQSPIGVLSGWRVQTVDDVCLVQARR